MGRHHRLLKLVAIFVIFCIFAQDVAMALPSQTTDHRPQTTDKTETPGSAEAHFRELGRFPSNLGHVDETFQGTNGHHITFILDAHDSLDAQKNIVRIIQQATASGQAQTVFEEGYEGELSTDEWFGGIQDATVRKKVSYYYLDQLKIGAAEFAHINRRKRLNQGPRTKDQEKSERALNPESLILSSGWKLIGADDKEAYLENVKTYADADRAQAKILNDLVRIDYELEALRKKLWSAESKHWFKRWQSFESGTLKLDDYLKIVFAHLPLGIQSEFPNLLSLSRVARGLSQATRGTVPNVSDLIAELDRFHEAMARNTFSNEQAYILWQMTRMQMRLVKLARLELSENEYELLKKDLPAFTTETLAKWIARAKKNPVVISKLWETNIRSALKFYELAHKRERAVERALVAWRDGLQTTDHRLQTKTKGTETPGVAAGISGSWVGEENEKETESETRDSSIKTWPVARGPWLDKNRNAILVFGGFHREGITALLRKNGFSYTVVIPKIAELSNRHQALYRRLMSASVQRSASSVQSKLVQAARPVSLFLSPFQDPGSTGTVDLGSVVVPREISALEELAAKNPHVSLDTFVLLAQKTLLKRRAEPRSGRAVSLPSPQSPRRSQTSTDPGFKAVSQRSESRGAEIIRALRKDPGALIDAANELLSYFQKGGWAKFQSRPELKGVRGLWKKVSTLLKGLLIEALNERIIANKIQDSVVDEIKKGYRGTYVLHQLLSGVILTEIERLSRADGLWAKKYESGKVSEAPADRYFLTEGLAQKLVEEYAEQDLLQLEFMVTRTANEAAKQILRLNRAWRSQLEEFVRGGIRERWMTEYLQQNDFFDLPDKYIQRRVGKKFKQEHKKLIQTLRDAAWDAYRVTQHLSDEEVVGVWLREREEIPKLEDYRQLVLARLAAEKGAEVDPDKQGEIERAIQKISAPKIKTRSEMRGRILSEPLLNEYYRAETPVFPPALPGINHGQIRPNPDGQGQFYKMNPHTPESQDFLKANFHLFNEAKAIAILNQRGARGIPELLEIGVTKEGQVWLLMRGISGAQTFLSDAWDSLYPEDQIELLAQSSDIVAGIHERGFAHLDLKRTNFIFTRGAQGKLQAMLIDFGSAEKFGDGVYWHGTELYAPPEHFDEGALATSAFDIFSFGRILELNFGIILEKGIEPVLRTYATKNDFSRLENYGISLLIEGMVLKAPAKRQPKNFTEVAAILRDIRERYLEDRPLSWALRKKIKWEQWLKDKGLRDPEKIIPYPFMSARSEARLNRQERAGTKADIPSWKTITYGLVWFGGLAGLTVAYFIYSAVKDQIKRSRNSFDGFRRKTFGNKTYRSEMRPMEKWLQNLKFSDKDHSWIHALQNPVSATQWNQAFPIDQGEFDNLRATLAQRPAGKWGETLWKDKAPALIGSLEEHFTKITDAAQAESLVRYLWLEQFKKYPKSIPPYFRDLNFRQVYYAEQTLKKGDKFFHVVFPINVHADKKQYHGLAEFFMIQSREGSMELIGYGAAAFPPAENENALSLYLNLSTKNISNQNNDLKIKHEIAIRRMINLRSIESKLELQVPGSQFGQHPTAPYFYVNLLGFQVRGKTWAETHAILKRIMESEKDTSRWTSRFRDEIGFSTPLVLAAEQETLLFSSLRSEARVRPKREDISLIVVHAAHKASPRLFLDASFAARSALKKLMRSRIAGRVYEYQVEGQSYLPAEVGRHVIRHTRKDTNNLRAYVIPQLEGKRFVIAGGACDACFARATAALAEKLRAHPKQHFEIHMPLQGIYHYKIVGILLSGTVAMSSGILWRFMFAMLKHEAFPRAQIWMDGQKKYSPKTKAPENFTIYLWSDVNEMMAYLNTVPRSEVRRDLKQVAEKEIALAPVPFLKKGVGKTTGLVWKKVGIKEDPAATTQARTEKKGMTFHLRLSGRQPVWVFKDTPKNRQAFYEKFKADLNLISPQNSEARLGSGSVPSSRGTDTFDSGHRSESRREDKKISSMPSFPMIVYGLVWFSGLVGSAVAILVYSIVKTKTDRLLDSPNLRGFPENQKRVVEWQIAQSLGTLYITALSAIGATALFMMKEISISGWIATLTLLGWNIFMLDRLEARREKIEANQSQSQTSGDPRLVRTVRRSEMRVLKRDVPEGEAEELQKLLGVKADQDGSFSKEVSSLEELKKITDFATQNGYVVVLPTANSANEMLQPKFSLSIRIYPRQVEAENFEQAMNVLLERQTRAGRVVEKDSALKWQPFMQIFEDGKTVIYVVYQKDKLTPGLFEGKIPKEIQKNAEHIFVFNPGRARRPGAAAPATQEYPDDDPASSPPSQTIQVAPPFIESEIPEQMFFWVAAEEAQDATQRWMVVVNRFPVLPPSLKTQEPDQPEAIVISHDVEPGRKSYAQNWMHREKNLADVLQMHAELEGVPAERRAQLAKVADYASFAAGAIFNSEKPDSYNVLVVGKNTNHVLAVNGYRHPDAPQAAHGGASQLHGHAQHINAHLPIKNLSPEAFTKIAELPLEEGFAEVLVMSREGKTALVLDYGTQRIFIFSRPSGKPAKFDGQFSFMELGGEIVVTSAARLFKLSTEETKELAAADDPTEWLMQNRARFIERGIHPDLLRDVQGAFKSTETRLTAAESVMRQLAHDLKDLHYLRAFLDSERATGQRDELFKGMPFLPSEVGKLLSPEKERFVWKKEGSDKPLLLSEKFPKGILALVMQLKELMIWGREAERGQIALRSMRYHAAGGHIFTYLKYVLENSGPALDPFTTKIEALEKLAEKNITQMRANQSAAEKEKFLEKALAANYEALQLIDQLGEWMAEQALEYYLRESSGPRLDWFYQNIASNRNLRKYMSRVLAKRAQTMKIDTDVEGIHAYRIEKTGESFILAINIGAIPTPDKDDSKRKARGKTSVNQRAQQILKASGISKGGRYQLFDAKTGAKEDGVLTTAQGMPLEIPEPEGLKLYRISKAKPKRITGIVTPQASGVDVRELQQSIESLLDQPEELKDYLTDLMEEAEQAAVNEESRKRLSAFMTLIAGLDPTLLDQMREWNPMTHASLKRVIAQNADFFSNRALITFHKPDRGATLVFSRSLPSDASGQKFGDNGQNVIFALQFEDYHVNPQDGKVWSVVRELGSDEKPLNLSREAMYQAQNLLEINQPIYETQASGAQFMRHWDIGIAVKTTSEKEKQKQQRWMKDQHDWGIDIYRILPVYPSDPKKQITKAVSLPQIPELMGAVNLMDIGATRREGGSVVYSDSFGKLSRLLPFFKAMGYGKIYLYGGLYEMGEMSRKLHGEPGNSDRYIVDNTTFPRTMIRGGYQVKRGGVLADNQGNSFSPVNMLDLNSRLSDDFGAEGFARGAHDKSRAQLVDLATAAKALEIKLVADFIPWLAPEGVNEENYKMFFYKELPDNFTQAQYKKHFKELSENEKQEVMKELITREGGFFVKRFGEPGDDRLVLIRHMFNEPGIDQAMPNPFHPLTQKYYLDTLKARLDDGIEEVRVDLAHKLLRENLKPIFDAWLRDGWQAGEGGEYRAEEEPFETVIRQAKSYAKEQGKTLEFDMEAYDTWGREHAAVHRRLQAIGADRAYYVPTHQDYEKLARGGLDANHFQALFEYVLGLKNGIVGGQEVTKLLEMIFASNYDEPSLNQMGGPKRAMGMLLLLMAKAGVPVMMDLRDTLDHFGQFIPIPGDRHPFPAASERERRPDFAGLVSELERAPSLQEAQALSGLETSQKPIDLVFLDNEKRYQFISAAWNNPDLGTAQDPEWRVVVMNFKPHEDQTIWVDSPVKEEGWVAVDTLTTGDETFPIQYLLIDGAWRWCIPGIVMPSNLPYRTLKIVPAAANLRSELRASGSDKSMHRSEMRKSVYAAGQAKLQQYILQAFGTDSKAAWRAAYRLFDSQSLLAVAAGVARNTLRTRLIQHGLLKEKIRETSANRRSVAGAIIKIYAAKDGNQRLIAAELGVDQSLISYYLKRMTTAQKKRLQSEMHGKERLKKMYVIFEANARVITNAINAKRDSSARPWTKAKVRRYLKRWEIPSDPEVIETLKWLKIWNTLKDRERSTVFLAERLQVWPSVVYKRFERYGILERFPPHYALRKTNRHSSIRSEMRNFFPAKKELSSEDFSQVVEAEKIAWNEAQAQGVEKLTGRDRFWLAQILVRLKNPEDRSRAITELMREAKGAIQIDETEKSRPEDGRTVYLELEKAVGEIRYLRLKGVRPAADEKGEVKDLPASSKGFAERFPVVHGSQIIMKASLSKPAGTFLVKNIERESEKMLKIQKKPAKNFSTDVVFATGEYKDLTFKGQKVGFLVAGMKQPDVRVGLEQFVFDYKKKQIVASRKVGRKKELIAIIKNQTVFMEKAGRAWREFHDRGIYHVWPHQQNWGLENTETDAPNFIFRDLDALAETTNQEEAATWRLYDLARIVTDLLRPTPNHVAREPRQITAQHLILPFLQGYFDETKISHTPEKLLSQLVTLHPTTIIFSDDGQKLRASDFAIFWLKLTGKWNDKYSFSKMDLTSSSTPVVYQQLYQNLLLIEAGANERHRSEMRIADKWNIAVQQELSRLGAPTVRLNFEKIWAREFKSAKFRKMLEAAKNEAAFVAALEQHADNLENDEPRMHLLVAGAFGAAGGTFQRFEWGQLLLAVGSIYFGWVLFNFNRAPQREEDWNKLKDWLENHADKIAGKANLSAQNLEGLKEGNPHRSEAREITLQLRGFGKRKETKYKTVALNPGDSDNVRDVLQKAGFSADKTAALRWSTIDEVKVNGVSALRAWKNAIIERDTRTIIVIHKDYEEPDDVSAQSINKKNVAVAPLGGDEMQIPGITKLTPALSRSERVTFTLRLPVDDPMTKRLVSYAQWFAIPEAERLAKPLGQLSFISQIKDSGVRKIKFDGVVSDEESPHDGDSETEAETDPATDKAEPHATTEAINDDFHSFEITWNSKQAKDVDSLRGILYQLGYQFLPNRLRFILNAEEKPVLSVFDSINDRDIVTAIPNKHRNKNRNVENDAEGDLDLESYTQEMIASLEISEPDQIKHLRLERGDKFVQEVGVTVERMEDLIRGGTASKEMDQNEIILQTTWFNYLDDAMREAVENRFGMQGKVPATNRIHLATKLKMTVAESEGKLSTALVILGDAYQSGKLPKVTAEAKAAKIQAHHEKGSKEAAKKLSASSGKRGADLSGKQTQPEKKKRKPKIVEIGELAASVFSERLENKPVPDPLLIDAGGKKELAKRLGIEENRVVPDLLNQIYYFDPKSTEKHILAIRYAFGIGFTRARNHEEVARNLRKHGFLVDYKVISILISQTIQKWKAAPLKTGWEQLAEDTSTSLRGLSDDSLKKLMPEEQIVLRLWYGLGLPKRPYKEAIAMILSKYLDIPVTIFRVGQLLEQGRNKIAGKKITNNIDVSTAIDQHDWPENLGVSKADIEKIIKLSKKSGGVYPPGLIFARDLWFGLSVTQRKVLQAIYGLGRDKAKGLKEVAAEIRQTKGNVGKLRRDALAQIKSRKTGYVFFNHDTGISAEQADQVLADLPDRIAARIIINNYGLGVPRIDRAEAVAAQVNIDLSLAAEAALTGAQVIVKKNVIIDRLKKIAVEQGWADASIFSKKKKNMSNRGSRIWVEQKIEEVMAIAAREDWSPGHATGNAYGLYRIMLERHKEWSTAVEHYKKLGYMGRSEQRMAVATKETGAALVDAKELAALGEAEFQALVKFAYSQTGLNIFVYGNDSAAEERIWNLKSMRSGTRRVRVFGNENEAITAASKTRAVMLESGRVERKQKLPQNMKRADTNDEISIGLGLVFAITGDTRIQSDKNGWLIPTQFFTSRIREFLLQQVFASAA